MKKHVKSNISNNIANNVANIEISNPTSRINKFSAILLATCLILAACVDPLKNKTKEEILALVQKNVQKKNYDNALTIVDTCRERFADEERFDDMSYLKAEIKYKQKNFKEAALILTQLLDRCACDSSLYKQAKKLLILCYCNQLKSYKRDYGLIEKLTTYNDFFNCEEDLDPTFQQTLHKLQSFISFRKVAILYRDLFDHPQSLTEALWICSMLIDPDNDVNSDEGCLRAMEIFVHTNDNDMMLDAKVLYQNLIAEFPDSQAARTAERLIAAEDKKSVKKKSR